MDISKAVKFMADNLSAPGSYECGPLDPGQSIWTLCPSAFQGTSDQLGEASDFLIQQYPDATHYTKFNNELYILGGAAGFGAFSPIKVEYKFSKEELEYLL